MLVPKRKPGKGISRLCHKSSRSRQRQKFPAALADNITSLVHATTVIIKIESKQNACALWPGKGDAMLSIAVCDDEIIVCSQIAKQIESALEGLSMPFRICQFNSGRELLEASGQFDLVFLDIMMQELDGMKTAGLFREKSFGGLLVFISSSREFVFDAYEAEPFWYLVKPIERKRLRKVLKLAVQKLKGQPREFLLVGSERQQVKLFLADICYLEIRGRVAYAHHKDGMFQFYGQIGVLERQLQGKGFFRCHKSYLVNLAYVQSYTRQELVLDHGEKIAIAKRRYHAFCRELLEYMKKNGGIF